MRHRNAGRKFGRDTSHRRAMFRNLMANLILHESIETTDAKAKELRRVMDRLISKAVRLGDLAFTPHSELTGSDRAKRLAGERRLGELIPRFLTVVERDVPPRKVDLIEKVLLDIARRYVGRDGGYTRIIKVGSRRGDNAPMSFVQLVS